MTQNEFNQHLSDILSNLDFDEDEDEDDFISEIKETYENYIHEVFVMNKQFKKW